MCRSQTNATIGRVLSTCALQRLARLEPRHARRRIVEQLIGAARSESFSQRVQDWAFACHVRALIRVGESRSLFLAEVRQELLSHCGKWPVRVLIGPTCQLL